MEPVVEDLRGRMSKIFIRNHSHYSLQVSISKPEDIAKTCKEQGYSAAGLTDITSVSGCVKFIKGCKDQKIKPIIGSDIRLSDGSFITLLCRNINGWRELLKVISEANSHETKDEPNIDFDRMMDLITPSNFVCIDGYNDYITSSLYQKTAYQDDRLNEYIQKMTELFDGSYFIERASREYPTERTIPCASSFYLKESDSIDHRVIICSKLKTTLKDLTREIAESGDVGLYKFLDSSDFYICPSEKLYSADQIFMSNMDRIDSLIGEFDILSKPKLPNFECPNNLSQNEYLKHLCREGWRKTVGLESLTQDQIITYRDRVLSELEVIEKANLAGYFLIVQDYVNEFKNKGHLIGPGRGCFLPDTRVKLANGNLSCISSLDINDVVLDAYSSPQTIENVIVYDINEEIVELEMENGRIIRCTKDHKFLTADGWKRAENLTQEDDIIEV